MSSEQLRQEKDRLAKSGVAKDVLKALLCDSNTVWAYPRACEDFVSVYIVRCITLGLIEDPRFRRHEFKCFLMAITSHGSQGVFVFLNHIFTNEACKKLVDFDSAREVVYEILGAMYGEVMAKHKKATANGDSMPETVPIEVKLVLEKLEKGKLTQSLAAKVCSRIESLSSAPDCVQVYAAGLWDPSNQRIDYVPHPMTRCFVEGEVLVGLPNDIDSALISAGTRSMVIQGVGQAAPAPAEVRDLGENQGKREHLVEDRLNSQSGRMGRLESEISQAQAKINDCVKSVTACAKSATNAQETLNAHETKLSKHGNTLSNHDGRLNGLESSRSVQGAEMRSFSHQLVALRQKNSRLQSSIEGSEHTFAQRQPMPQNGLSGKDEIVGQDDFIGFDTDDPDMVNIEIEGLQYHIEEINENFEQVKYRMSKILEAVEKREKRAKKTDGTPASAVKTPGAAMKNVLEKSEKRKADQISE